MEVNRLDDLDIKERLLGSGYISKVKLATHRVTGKTYAIKIVNIKSVSPEEADALNREISIQRSLRHPYIVQMINSFLVQDKLYIILEYVERGTLFDYMQINPLDDFTIARIFGQVVSAISSMHARKILHRDIKPENILVDKSGDVKLCDFGFCAPFGENVLRKTMCGTREYMPPEMINSAKQNEKVDIWCLGILLYELTHKRTPFNTTSLPHMITEIKAQRINYKPTLNAEFKNIIQLCLQYEPSKRPSAEQLLSFPIIKNSLEPALSSRSSLVSSSSNSPTTFGKSTFKEQNGSNSNQATTVFQNHSFNNDAFQTSPKKQPTQNSAQFSPPTILLQKADISPMKSNQSKINEVPNHSHFAEKEEIEYVRNPKTGYFEKVKKHDFDLMRNRAKSVGITDQSYILPTTVLQSTQNQTQNSFIKEFHRAESLQLDLFKTNSLDLNSIKLDSFRSDQVPFSMTSESFRTNSLQTAYAQHSPQVEHHLYKHSGSNSLQGTLNLQNFSKKIQTGVSNGAPVPSKHSLQPNSVIQQNSFNPFDYFPEFRKPSKSIEGKRDLSPHFAISGPRQQHVTIQYHPLSPAFKK